MWNISNTYKNLATVLLVTNSAIGAAELVLVVVAAEAGELPSAPVERDLGALTAILTRLPASA